MFIDYIAVVGNFAWNFVFTVLWEAGNCLPKMRNKNPLN